MEIFMESLVTLWSDPNSGSHDPILKRKYIKPLQRRTQPHARAVYTNKVRQHLKLKAAFC